MRSNRRGRHWSLRATLIAEQTVLLAMVCLVIGVAVMLSLRAFLLTRLDTDLREAADRTRALVQPRPPSGGPPMFDNPAQQSGTIEAVVLDGRVSAQLNEIEGPRRTVEDISGDPAVAALAGVRADGSPREVDLGQRGVYRAVAFPMRSATVITALPMADVHDTLWTVALALGGVSLIGLVVAGAAGALLVRRALRPLDRMAATAQRVAQLPLHEGEVALPDRVPAEDTDPGTEVGKVGGALNRMLDHVGDALAARHDSETRVRRFVADASHELRTPLAAIRGYTELARREEVPADVAHALSRVDSESARMTTLVEDLLLLARLDSGRPLPHEPVDLSALVVTAVGDAQVAGPGHHWRLDLPAEPVTVPGDGGRLHQVVTNLLANARTHTPPGTTVSVSLTTATPAEVTLAVADDGPGIPPTLLPTVFERFARGDTSRSRAAGSTGLGLAIVAAVVSAHGGEVTVSSAPGRTVFTVRLPHS